MGCNRYNSGDMSIPAVYRSLDARRRNARRPNPRPEAELAHDVAITLTPLPVWADLTPDALRAKHAALVAEIEAEHAGAAVLGAAHLIAEDPDATPVNKLEPSPAPACHAFCARVRARFLAAYATFRDHYKRASERLRTWPRATPPRSPPRSRPTTRPPRLCAPAGTSPHPPTSPPPGSAASTTPTSRSPERHSHVLALTRLAPRPQPSLPGPPGCHPWPAGRPRFRPLPAGDARLVPRRDSPRLTPHVRSDALQPGSWAPTPWVYWPHAGAPRPCRQRAHRP